MKMNFTKADVIIENRKNGVQPAMFIIEDGRVHMVTITPDQQFNITDEGPVGERYDDHGNWCGDKDNIETTPTKFTWSDKEDPELYKNGVTILWVAGRSKAIQKFVETLSYKINSKCDFSFTAGRAHIDCFKKATSKALEFINNEEFMKQFIVPYSSETYNNETYFEPLNMGP